MTPTHAARPDRPRRGAVLLEVLLALVLFVAAGLSTMSLVDHVMDSAARVRDQERASDLARSALSRLEAGLATPESLSGPVKDEGADRPATDEGWVLEVDTAPSNFSGLTLVTVRAMRTPSGRREPDVQMAVRQLVRLTREAGAKPATDPLAAMRGDAPAKPTTEGEP